jgi:periplasmic divalent cation tolerance protein
MSHYRMVLVTVPDEENATIIANGLVAEKLAACVNIIPDIRSVYAWQGHIHSDRESLLICKTTEAVWPQLQEWILAHHPYEVPEIVQLPLLQGLPAYLYWMDSCLSPEKLI